MAEEKKEFYEYYRNIIRQKNELYRQHELYMYIGAPREKLEDVFKECSGIRSGIIDLISEVSVYYNSDLEHTINEMLLDSDPDDVTIEGINQYYRYSVEDFLNKIIEEVYEIHNELVMMRLLPEVQS